MFIVPTSLLQTGPNTVNNNNNILTTEDILLGATGRRYNPNMPPSYDQAVSGQDKSIKVVEGTTMDQSSEYPPPEYSTSDTTRLLV